MNLDDFILKLNSHGIDFKIAEGDFKPRVAVLTKKDILFTFKIYSNNINLTDENMDIVGRAFNLPRNWYKT